MNEQVTTKMKIYISGKIGTDTITPEIRDKCDLIITTSEDQAQPEIDPPIPSSPTV